MIPVNLTEFDVQTLRDLEESLWRSETRFNLEHQETVFAPDFFEFGRSGRMYTREQMIQTAPTNTRQIAAARFQSSSS